MRTPIGQEVHITTVVVRRPPGAAPLNPAQVHRKVLASLNSAHADRSRLYLCLSLAGLVGAVWADYSAFHPH